MKKLLAIGIIAFIAISLASPVQAGKIDDLIDSLKSLFTSSSKEETKLATLDSGNGDSTITYGNGWKKITYPDGTVDYTMGVKTFQRHDAVWCSKDDYNSTVSTSSDPLYDYEVREGQYLALFKANPSTAQSVKLYATTEDYFTFQPHSLNYRNDLSQIQQISITQSVIGTPQQNKFAYPNVFGTCLDLSYTYNFAWFKEELAIASNTTLPVPEQYIIDGGNTTLDLDFFIDFPSSVDCWVDGEIWDKKNLKTTSNDIVFKKEGETIYTLPKPYASSNGSVYGDYLLKKQGGKLYITLKTPYEWLNDTVNRTHPIIIDPTWVVGSGGDAWGGIVSFDNTVEDRGQGYVVLNVLPDDYIFYFPFTKGSGTTVYDWNETNKNDGILYNTPTWTGEGIDFETDNNQYIELNSIISMSDNSPWTVVVSFKPESVSLEGLYGNLYTTGNKTRAYYYSTLSKFYIYNDANEYKSWSWLPTAGETYQVAITCNGANSSNLELFVDSVSKGTQSLADSSQTIKRLASTGATNYRCLDGFMYYFYVYNRNLTLSEINQTRDNEHHSTGNLTSWHDAGSGNETYKLSVNFTFPANTNASINLYNNDTGTFIETLATNNNTEQWSKTITGAVQDSKVNITLHGNVSETPEVHNITYHTQVSGVADTSFTVTLPSGYAYAQFEPVNSTAQNVTPNGQSASQEFYNVTHTGSGCNLDIRLQLNATVSDITLKADDDNTSSGASTIGTSLVTIYTGLTPTNSVDVWLWSDFNHAIEQQTNKTLSINVTQS